jgi:hypothetical protein
VQPEASNKVGIYRTGLGIAAFFIFAFFALHEGLFTDLGKTTYQGAAVSVATTSEVYIRIPTHVDTPKAVRGIYMTSCIASSKTLRENLVKLIDDTELNSVVIDVKTYDGYISFLPGTAEFTPAVGGCFVRDMQDFIDYLHSKNIYVIGRVAAFQDAFRVKESPDLAVKKASATTTIWRDYKGIPWIDAGAKPHWDYLVALAKDAHNIGFDEINFDYIRFPSDGNMRDIYFPWSKNEKKSDVIRTFFEYLHTKLSPQGIVLSADLFGMTTTNKDDLNIGQLLENALPYFDYIAPMVYPSHYPPSFLGLGDPNKHVYTVVNYSMSRAVERAIATTTTIILPNARIGTSTLYLKPSYDPKKFRPWLQDNNYPVVYTAEMVRDQIRAAYDAGLDSWMLWNAGNRYTRSALEPATK